MTSSSNGVNSSHKPAILGLQGVQGKDASSYHVNYGAHREGITPSEVTEYYNNWAKTGTYEQDLCPGRYNGPVYAADAVDRYGGALGCHARILDMAAGTGLVGEKLAEKGYTNVDGLDPAQGMLDIASRKGVYKTYICDILGPEATSLPDDAYDVAVLSGGMGEGHIPCCALQEMIRIVKSGGVVILVMREEYLSYVKEYKDTLEPTMDRLQQSGLWQRLERTVVPSYSFNKNGVVFVYKVLVAGHGVRNGPR